MAHRLAELLGLGHPGSSQSSMDSADFEHRKRVWWTTVCMELMTCTELSLRPNCGLENLHLDFPDNTKLSVNDAQDFSDPQYLTAQIELCRIKYNVVRTICELRSGSLEEAYSLISPCLDSLRHWRAHFRTKLDFSEIAKFAGSTLTHPSMRTIASLVIRYNQVG